MRLRRKRRATLAASPANDGVVSDSAVATDADSNEQELDDEEPAMISPTSTPNPTSRFTQRIHLPHNSLFVLGPLTNQHWLHGIPSDKRLAFERAPEELAFAGQRISLTFRHIGTFLSADEHRIWGQGAVAKMTGDCEDEVCGGREVVVADEQETKRLIEAFGRENRAAGEWNWDEVYGCGFDVLHFRASG